MLAQSEKLAQARRISLLLGSAGSAAADFSQALLMVSYFSLMVMLLSVHAVVKWGIASACPAFMGGLSPVLYLLVVSRTVPACCTGPPCWKCPKPWRIPPKIHWFLPSYSSLYFCSQVSYQKTEKTQILAITVQYQFSYWRPPNQRLS